MTLDDIKKKLGQRTYKMILLSTASKCIDADCTTNEYWELIAEYFTA